MVLALTGGPSMDRVTVALLVRAGGLMLQPHFVFKGAPGGSVEAEVRNLALPDVATFSVLEHE